MNHQSLLQNILKVVCQFLKKKLNGGKVDEFGDVLSIENDNSKLFTLLAELLTYDCKRLHEDSPTENL